MTANGEYSKYLGEIEVGKAVLRAEGLNFLHFKIRMRNYFINGDQIDEDSMVQYYNDFASTKAHYANENLRHWAASCFQDFNKDEHQFWLKKKMRKYI